MNKGFLLITTFQKMSDLMDLETSSEHKICLTVCTAKSVYSIP